MKRLLQYVLALGAAAGLAFAAQAQTPISAERSSVPAAQHRPPLADAPIVEVYQFAQRGGISASQAVQAARSRYPGSRYVDTFAVYANGQVREHVVVLVTRDGRRAFVRVDARSGRVIGECASRRACGG